ncbi:type II toxin-antitoxin system VapC family toxin [Paenibacillus alba]|uniref:type II toxin-antitoxin system VapC family toxin n=1 Tax=Paenibacillus alba TaxID=1197127 RepID=UPI001567748C|nr:type II toxin-antitoxin system VapC family toxin [Paenibacillus alba]NQX71809.1 type II toxin-antitoxin system VapC family toxin [Paenibacillus alba]
MLSKDLTYFNQLNLIDSCAVWNLLSTTRLYNASKEAKIHFILTSFILYECLYKPRKNENLKDNELKRRLIQERERGHFKDVNMISIEDLQQLDIIENRKRLSKGELTAIACALRLNNAGFVTDDRGARNMAVQVLDDNQIRTTPNLLGWLFYNNFLQDSDYNTIIDEHKQFIKSAKDDLSIFLEIMYKWAKGQQLSDKINVEAT